MFAVVGPFAESLRATLQPCTFLLIVPTLTAVVVARARWQALAAATVAAVVGGWVLIDNRWILDGWLLQLSAVFVAVLLVLMIVPLRRISHARLDAPIPQAFAVGVLTLIATMWWRPCVGTELGKVLNGAQDDVAGQLVPMAAYMLGALVPVAVIVAIRYAAEPSDRIITSVVWSAGAVGVVVAVSLAAGQHDDVVVTLTRWTLE